MGIVIFISVSIILLICLIKYSYKDQHEKDLELWKDFFIKMSKDGRVVDIDDKPLHILEVGKSEGSFMNRPNLESKLQRIYNDKRYVLRAVDGQIQLDQRHIVIHLKFE